ncbi:MAG: di-heme oxidoredictase family protein [Pseudomonadota bacterium]
MRLLPVLLAASLLPLSAIATTERSLSPITVDSQGHKAFGHALPALSDDGFVRMHRGKLVFVRTWEAAGSGTSHGGHTGLGPLYNATSCADCHYRDGRGARDGGPTPLIYGLRDVPSVPASWGQQLQTFGAGVSPEGAVSIEYREHEVHLGDGTSHTLRQPRYALVGRDDADALAPRTAPTLIGLGLLEAIAAADIVAAADPHDRDADGISGRVSWLPGTDSLAPVVGRFGWKATQRDLPEQIAKALAEDMGIDSRRWVGTRGPTEITDQDFDRLVEYVRVLAPPAPRRDDPLYTSGKAAFNALGCADCHRAEWTLPQTVKAHAPWLPPGVGGENIAPYTDLLLHDLGPALADGDGQDERSREWRTPPLWGLGLMSAVNGNLRLLHDGRAHSFEEAILWHGGEAREARAGFQALQAEQRRALLAFLESI